MKINLNFGQSSRPLTAFRPNRNTKNLQQQPIEYSHLKTSLPINEADRNSPQKEIEFKCPTSQLKGSTMRPKSSYLGNPTRQINYEAKVFTTDVISIDKHLDDVEEIIQRFNNRPRSTEKNIQIDIDLHDKYKQMQKLQETLKRDSIISSQYQSQIASYVITGKKIQSPLKIKEHRDDLNKDIVEIPTSENALEQQIQTEEAPTLTESQFIFEDQEDLDMQKQFELEYQKKMEPNLLYKGAHMKVYKPVKPKVSRGRPQTAALNKIPSKRQSSQPSSIKNADVNNQLEQEDEQEMIRPMHIEELHYQSKFDYDKMERTIQDDTRNSKPVFGSRKQKIVELSEYLNLVLHDYQNQQYQENQQEIEKTMTKFNLTEQIEDDNFGSLINTKRTVGGSNKSIVEIENKRQEEESMIHSTGLRLRRLTAKYGPKVDLVSHGFQRFKVQEIEQFFDPLRLKLMIVPMSDIPNQYTKQGSDFHFVKGFKLQQMKDHQGALNAYEDGIREYPESSYNCKFNKAVILFKLGLFKEALNIYRLILREDPLDKRICYNKAICEIQNGMYSQAIYTIDSYINDYNERKARYDKAQKGDNTISYQEKIQMQKANYIPDDQYLFEIYQMRGVACLRGNRIVDASKSFTVAYEFKSHVKRKTSRMSQQQSQMNSNEQSIDREKSSKNEEANFTEFTAQRNSHSVAQSSSNQNYKANGQNQDVIRYEDQALESRHRQEDIKLRIRPITAKLPKSQSQRILVGLTDRLETLEEENQMFNEHRVPDDSEENCQQESKNDLFSLDAESIMKTLDNYEAEHRQIKRDLGLISKQQVKKQFPEQFNINVNRNIDDYLTAKQKSLQQKPPKLNRVQSNFYFTQKNNFLFNVDKPQGAIAQFVTYQNEQIVNKRDDKLFQQKLKTYDISSIQEKITKNAIFSTINSLQASQTDNDELKNFLMQRTDRTEEQKQEVEENIIMRPQDFYIDEKKQVRLDKVLLGFEIDPLNDSITDKELEIREKRHRIEQELLSADDSFYKKLERENQQRNKDYFMQFLEISEKDAIVNSLQKRTEQDIKELDKMKGKIGHIRQYIEKTFNDPAKIELNLDKTKAMAAQMNHMLEATGQNLQMSQSSKLIESLSTTDNEDNPKQAKLLRRFNLQQIEQVIEQFQLPVSQRDNKVLHKGLGSLKFFIKFPPDIRQQLFDLSILRRFDKGETIFNQGDPSEDFFVIVKGSVCVRVIKEELGNVPVNTRICYDGDYIGELAHFEVSESLTQEIVDELNKQRVTTKALEYPTYMLQLNKKIASRIINSPDLQNKYEERINFLRQLDIFADIDMYILLPLASNIKVKKYKHGEYIVKAGDLPDGLIIVTEGQCIVCAEKLAMRANQPSEYSRLRPMNPNVKTNPTNSSQMILDKEQLKSKNLKQMMIKGTTSQADMKYYSDSLAQVNTNHKGYQNEQILVDDKGRRMKDFTVYKDLMIFFHLLPKSYFGGRVLLPVQNKKETEDERGTKSAPQENKRRGAWFAGGHQPKSTNESNMKLVLGGDFEHLFIKRRYSMTTQKIIKNDRSSMLSIANSSSVEVYLIDQQLLEFFPEHTQKHIWNKLMNVFEPDRPYMLKNVQKIKDKFREWDVYKIKCYQESMKQNYSQRRAHKQKQVVELDR
ncbi:cyclic nucleotide-binding domain containing protein [Stylonychia lemnae]|uniref:Cyclic nucleotide-binding domain containing protein n=1 Tax=Stylonychia lemnae TaxID=5949 RepID=A0A078AWR8_STYLE|nr:cyclic nucleotide-binding domain containing protein [Stylonychia lemnae]|eukprot:CDW86496.1 cyclic nucleotide-binding domain containing protein [Stylonychia lemnae]